ncbi:hypothetical protein Tco_0213431 [Tanacetum coccineum]
MRECSPTRADSDCTPHWDVAICAEATKSPLRNGFVGVANAGCVVDKAPKHKAAAKKLASVVVNDPAELDQEKDKEKHKAPAKEPGYVCGDEDMKKGVGCCLMEFCCCGKCDVRCVKVSDALKNKVVCYRKSQRRRVKKVTVDKDNDKSIIALNINLFNFALRQCANIQRTTKSKAHSDVVPVAEKPKPNPNPKQKEKSTVQELSEVPVLRSTKKIKKEESDEESVPKKSLDTGDKIEVTRQKIHDMLGVPIGGYSLFDLDEREADHEFVKLWVGQFHPLELRDLQLLYLDSAKFDRFPVVRTSEEKLASICSERVRLEDLLRKANSVSIMVMVKLHGDDGDDDDGDSNGDDDGTRDDDARGDSDVNQDDDNADSRNDIRYAFLDGEYPMKIPISALG